MGSPIEEVGDLTSPEVVVEVEVGKEELVAGTMTMSSALILDPLVPKGKCFSEV